MCAVTCCAVCGVLGVGWGRILGLVCGLGGGEWFEVRRRGPRTKRVICGAIIARCIGTMFN